MTQVSESRPAPSTVPVRGARLRKLVRFGVIGVVSTVAYALLYLGLRQLVDAFAANALALLVTAVANTAANRRVTFGISGRSGVVGDHAVGLVAFGAGLVLTTGSLAVLHTLTDAGHRVELVVLTAANLAATLLRFVALQLRIGSRRPARSAPRVHEHAGEVVDGSAA